MIRRLIATLALAGTTAATWACIAMPVRPVNSTIEMHLTEQRALLYRQGGEEHLILSVKYEGATSQFAWVIPTETRPQIDVQQGAPFHELWHLTEIAAPRAAREASEPGLAGAAAPPVTVLEQKVAGPYEMTVLSARESGGLYDWLKSHGYNATPEARQALDVYVKRGWFFAATRIRPGGGDNATIQQNLKNGTIAAIHLHYKASRLSYPLRVTAGNPGTSRMEVYAVGEHMQGNNLLQEMDFHLKPSGGDTFAVDGPPGLAFPSGDYPTLHALLPQGGTLTKYTGTLTVAQRQNDLVFGP